MVHSAKVDYSVFLVQKWGEGCILMHGRYLTPTCKVFLLGSKNLGVLSCVLATSYAFWGEVFCFGVRKVKGVAWTPFAINIFQHEQQSDRRIFVS